MPNRARRKPLLVVLAALAFLLYLKSRETSYVEDLPVFSSEPTAAAYVELVGSGFGGVYQINDALRFADVIKMTGWGGDAYIADLSIASRPVQNGERFHVEKKGRKIQILENGWMSAGKRMALLIPLHPDRMQRQDWTALPGIGAKLAARIEADRQINGEFGALLSLKRVRGIGKKSLKRWQGFFEEP